MDNVTFQVADYAASLSFADLPDEVVHTATQRIVDSLGCAIGAYHCEQALIGRRLAPRGEISGWNRGRVLGFREWTAADYAAFINTAMIRNLDYDDVLPGGHPSECLGALLAVAEAAGADGRRLITSTVVAYEVFIRITQAAKMRKSGWDQGFQIGIATAAALGNLFGWPRDIIGHAVSIMAVANVPLRATRAGLLSLWKGAAVAYATRDAVFATLLVAEGMTGPDRPFEGRHGFWEKVSGPFEMEPFGARGGDFLISQARIKYWPLEGSAQPAVWAGMELRSKVNVGDLTAIDIYTDWAACNEIGSEPEKWDPKTRETADHSFPYILARALVDGSVGIASFEESAYLDPALRPLMAKMKVHVDPEIEAKWPATQILRVEATTRQGERLRVEVVNPPGHEANPLQDADIEKKFRSLAEPVLGEQSTSLALSQWWALQQTTDLSAALGLLDLEKQVHQELH